MSSSFVGSLSSIWLLFRESQVSHPSSAAVKLTSLSYQYWFLCVPTCCIFAINMFAFCTLALSAWGCKFFKSLGENLCLNHSCFSSTPAIGSTTCRGGNIFLFPLSILGLLFGILQIRQTKDRLTKEEQAEVYHTCIMHKECHWWIIQIEFGRRQWHPTPVLLPGKSHGQRSLVGCSPWGR